MVIFIYIIGYCAILLVGVVFFKMVHLPSGSVTTFFSFIAFMWAIWNHDKIKGIQKYLERTQKEKIDR